MNDLHWLKWSRIALRIAISGDVLRNSVAIALVVGTVLNVVNQWNSVMAGADVQLAQLGLNYLVPFCVASFSALQTRLHGSRGACPPAAGKDASRAP